MFVMIPLNCKGDPFFVEPTSPLYNEVPAQTTEVAAVEKERVFQKTLASSQTVLALSQTWLVEVSDTYPTLAVAGAIVNSLDPHFPSLRLYSRAVSTVFDPNEGKEIRTEWVVGLYVTNN